MARKPTVKIEAPEIFHDPTAQLTPSDIIWLRGVLYDPRYVKLLRIAEASCPGPFAAGTHGAFINQNTMLASTIALSTQRGWKLAVKAPYVLLQDPPKPRKAVEANYPDSGTIENDKTH